MTERGSAGDSTSRYAWAVRGWAGATAPPPREPRSGPPRHLLVAALVLAVLVTPVAVAGETGGETDGGAPEAVSAADGDPLVIGSRNRSTRETGQIANNSGYSLRLSNVRRGRGGGVVSGCRASIDRINGNDRDEACTYADNLNDGLAFLFRARGGNVAGEIRVDNPAASPLRTNATGVATGFNADKVDGLDAADLQGQTGPQGPAGPAGPAGPQGPAGATSLRIVTNSESVSAGTSNFITAECDTGTEVATGGGMKFDSPLDSDRVVHVGPTNGAGTIIAAGTPRGWGGRIYNGAGFSRNARAYAICASP